MEGICRACLSKSREPTNLIQYTEKNRHLFVYCTGIQVKKNDFVPFQLCKDCYVNMRMACKFKKQCRYGNKRINHFITLKDSGESIDFNAYLKSDDLPSLRLPNLNGHLTPVLQRDIDDDNESTNTSIRNFVKDLLRPEEIQETEARIIKEVINEEADILEDSLDSHWLQDDMSIDTDFKFSFSPFFTPFSRNKVRSPSTVSRYVDQDISTVPTNNEAFIAAKRNLLWNSSAVDLIEKYRMENDETTENMGDVEMQPADDISNNVESVSECDDTNEIANAIKHITRGVGYYKDKEDETCANNRDQILGTVSQYNDVVKGVTTGTVNVVDVDVTKNINDPIDQNLERALQCKDADQVPLYDILATPPLNPCVSGVNTLATPPFNPCVSGANTPTIANILFGDEQPLQDEITNKTGHVIENYDNVEGSEVDILEDFFNKETGEYIGDCRENVPEELHDIDEQNENIRKEHDELQEKQISDKAQPEINNFNGKLIRSAYDFSDYSCKICSTSYKNARGLIVHFTKIHKVKISLPAVHRVKPGGLCPCCGVEKAKNLEQHLKRCEMNKKNGDTVHRCTECDRVFSTKYRLEMHNRIHSGTFLLKNNVRVQCQICGKCFSNSSNLATHTKRHNKVFTCECDICNRKYVRKCDLIVHIRSHLNLQPFTCACCKKTFTRSDALSRHMNSHINSGFKCQVCGKKLISLANYKVHMKSSNKCKELRKIDKLRTLKDDEKLSQQAKVMIEGGFKCLVCSKHLNTLLGYRAHIKSSKQCKNFTRYKRLRQKHKLKTLKDGENVVDAEEKQTTNVSVNVFEHRTRECTEIGTDNIEHQNSTRDHPINAEQQMSNDVFEHLTQVCIDESDSEEHQSSAKFGSVNTEQTTYETTENGNYNGDQNNATNPDNTEEQLQKTTIIEDISDSYSECLTEGCIGQGYTGDSNVIEGSAQTLELTLKSDEENLSVEKPEHSEKVIQELLHFINKNF